MNDELNSLTVWRKLWYDGLLWWFLGIIWALREKFGSIYFSHQDIDLSQQSEYASTFYWRDIQFENFVTKGEGGFRKRIVGWRLTTGSGRWWGFQVESLLKVGRRRVPFFIHPIQSLEDVQEMLNHLSPNLELYGNLRQGGVCVRCQYLNELAPQLAWNLMFLR